MANKDATDLFSKTLHMSEYGHGWNEDYGPVNMNGVQIADVVRLGRIPAGVRVQSGEVRFGAAGASVTCSIGYAPADGTTPAADAAGFVAAGQSMTSAGTIRFVKDPITFDKDVFLTVTIAGAAVTGSPTIVGVVNGKVVGIK